MNIDDNIIENDIMFHMDRLFFPHHFTSYGRQETIPNITLEDVLLLSQYRTYNISIADGTVLVELLNNIGPDSRYHPHSSQRQQRGRRRPSADADADPDPSSLERLNCVSLEFSNNEETKLKNEKNRIVSLTINISGGRRNNHHTNSTPTIVVPLIVRKFDMLEELHIFDYKSIQPQPKKAQAQTRSLNSAATAAAADDDDDADDAILQVRNVKRLFITRFDARSRQPPRVIGADAAATPAAAAATTTTPSPAATAAAAGNEDGTDNGPSSSIVQISDSTTMDVLSATEEPHILEIFPNLEVLSFRQCSNVIEDILKYDLSETRCRNLKHYPTERMKSLTRLEFKYCNMKHIFSSSSLMTECALRTNLTYLGLEYCSLTEDHLEFFLFDMLHQYPNLITANFAANEIKTLRFISQRLRSESKKHKKDAIIAAAVATCTTAATTNKQIITKNTNTKFRRLILKDNPFAIRSMLVPSSKTFLGLLKKYKCLSDFGVYDLSPEVDKLRRTNHVENVLSSGVPLGLIPVILQETSDNSDVYAFLRYSPLLQLIITPNR